MNTYLIDFKDTATSEEISAYLTSAQCMLVKEFHHLNKVYQVIADTVPPMTDLVESIKDDDELTIKLLGEIPMVTPIPASSTTIELTSTLPDDWWKTYSMKAVDFNETQVSVPIYGAGVNIYLVDSGIKIDHPEFDNSDITLLYSFNNDFTDYKGHGTALASVAVGATCSLTNASLKVVKIFEPNTDTKLSDLLNAFNVILADAQVSNNKLSIVNLSWSIEKNQYIEDKIQLLINAGLIVVASAGNNGMPIGDVTPAAMHDVVTVGSYNQEFKPSDFSNYTDPTVTSLTLGPTNYGIIDVWAPGEYIKVATLTGEYGYTAGTSLSAIIHSASIAYTESQQLATDGNLLPFKRDSGGKVLIDQLYSLRNAMLDLSDPKYEKSVNTITTYIDHNIKQTRPQETASQPIAMINNSSFHFRFCNRYLTASYEILSPLPEWLTIENNWMILRPKLASVQEPYETTEIVYRLNDKDGTVHDQSLLVYLTNTSDELEALGIANEDVNVTLSYTCSGGYCQNRACSSYCASAKPCYCAP